MGFRFLHTADWQLGKPFGQFGSEIRPKLEQARLDAIDHLAKAARDGGASHVLVAGDVFDQAHPAPTIVARMVDRLRAASDLQWLLLPGNHDPAGTASVWERLLADGLPGHVRPLLKPLPLLLEAGVTVLPAPVTSKAMGRDPTAWFGAPVPEGPARIGLAHGSVKSFSGQDDPDAVIPPDRADRSGLAYLALGDWHGAQRAGPRAWYPGTPEPDSFVRNDKGKALLVDLDEPDAPLILPIGSYCWRKEELVLDPEQGWQGPLSAVIPAGRILDRELLELTLRGTLPHAEEAALDTYLERAATRLAALRLRRTELSYSQPSENWTDILGDTALGAVAARLSSRQNAGEEAASQALSLLARFAQEEA